MPNRLAIELSPYLLQHAENPVEWFPWGEEAFEQARQQQKPIFLSIGYASCHWCHVMAHESFENPAIAKLLNKKFISIKVDREERPDLDMVYMEAVQLMTGRGGWPMSVFLTPAGEPFFGGTYWPLHAQGGTPGFDQVLRAIADVWHARGDEMRENAKGIAQLLRAAIGEAAPTHSQGGRSDSAIADMRAIQKASDEAEMTLRQSFDRQDGGFGAAPRFPQPLALRWLLRRWRATGEDDLLRMVTTTLDHMAAGGVFDQLGGGFHRYAVDSRWLVPHFEKMLYDNAMLAVCYLEAWQATGEQAYAEVTRQTLDYLLRDMTDPLGGFYDAEDADSEGQEGKFYLWTPAEIEAVLGGEAATTFCEAYDVTPEGNFEGRNVLNRLGSVQSPFGRNEIAQLADARRVLLAERSRRVRPGRDDKILVSWNALAVEAFALAGAALAEPRYSYTAQRAADFLWTRVRAADGGLLRYWRAGQARQDAFLDDYAGLANAMVTLHETDGRHLGQASTLADQILTRFADSSRGGFYFSPKNDTLIVRPKDALDNPLPSGNGQAAMLFTRLHGITGRDDFLAAAQGTFHACLAWIEQAPTATFQLLLAAGLAESLMPAGKTPE
ncbi:MAG: thioredoxin domain-containing protein [Planctomycetaceae bacterium]|nr:thioredoxin domain-containing protein [Planctomycetaceae bacterium]